MRKPFLIIQLRPEDAAADNEFAAILRYGRLNVGEVERLRIERAGLPDIDLDDYAAIVVGGSPFDMSIPGAAKSAVQQKIESGFMRLLEPIVESDFPFLGACSGNSLLGKFCGATISTRHAEPVGGVDIVLTEEGTRDPLLQGFPAHFRALLGHKEACDDVPPGATLLAASENCPVQMFRLRTNVYATQFHPEGDLEGFTVRINVYKNHGYFAPEAVRALIAAIAAEKTPFAQQILERFVRRFRTPA